jgi:hypothetical protein
MNTFEEEFEAIMRKLNPDDRLLLQKITDCWIEDARNEGFEDGIRSFRIEQQKEEYC